MNDNLTAITILLDRSGSMTHLQNDVIEGVNKFIREQRDVDGEATLSLVQFDDRYEENYTNLPIDSAEFLSSKTYVPRGSTALLDAMGRCIKNTKARIKAMDKENRPAKVIFLAFTDGRENASKEWTKEKLAKLVAKQEDKHNWKIIFLGANIDSFGAGASYGMQKGNIANFKATKRGMSRAFRSASIGASYARNSPMEVYTASSSILRDAGVAEDIGENDSTAVVGTTVTTTTTAKKDTA